MAIEERVRNMIRNIKELKLKDKFIFGTKASALGELINNRINVPEGFALSTEIFEEFLQYNSFPYTYSDYMIRNEEIQDFILNSKFSDTALLELKKYYLAITNNHKFATFAVRSSSLCEDTKNFSMAGMFNSYVNLSSFELVIESIKKCYASLFQDKVLAFAINNNISMEKLKMGVIIQRFIEGDFSGVNFSADVIEMNFETVCINIVSGTCENYVSGKISSSLYKLDKQTGREISSIIVTDSPEPSSKILERLFHKTLEVEEIFKCFQDIEWTIHNNELYILQSRPITTFKNKQFDLNWKKPEDAEYEWWLGPPFPFPQLVLDICPVEEAAFLQGAYKTGYSERNMARIIQNGYIYFRNKALPNFKEKREKFFNEVDNLSEQGLNIFQDVLQPKLDELICKLNNYLNKNLSYEELTEFLDLALEYLKKATSFHWPAEAGIRYIEIFNKYCDNILGELTQRDYYDLIYKKSIITKEREILFDMADLVKSDTSLIRLFNSCLYDEILFLKLKNYDKGIKLLDKIKVYLQEFGICDAGYDDFIRPVLIERPEGIISKIRSLLEIDSESFFKSITLIEKNKERILETILKKLSKEKYNSFKKKLEVAEKAFLVTDTHNYYIERQSWGYLRLAVMEVAKVLKAANIISEVKDVFYLTFDELKADLSLKTINPSLITKRKKLFEKQKGLLPPRNIGKAFTSSLNSIDKVKVHSENNSSKAVAELKGMATFNGKIKGRITKGIPQSIDDDCILVVFHGHCADITHLLRRVKGLIFENGSPFDHLGIISREMNIPAIYYVKNALSLLNDGDIVEIDGTNNVIDLIIV